MNIKVITTLLMLAFAPLASADFVTVSRAYELEPEHVQIPVSTASNIRFSNCDGCKTESGQLTANTRFMVDGKTVSFEKFCDAMRLAKRSENAGIVLLHHLESNKIKSVSVFL